MITPLDLPAHDPNAPPMPKFRPPPPLEEIDESDSPFRGDYSLFSAGPSSPGALGAPAEEVEGGIEDNWAKDFGKQVNFHNPFAGNMEILKKMAKVEAVAKAKVLGDPTDLHSENFDQKIYIARNLNNATETDISEFHNKLTGFHDKLIIDKKEMIHGNYTTFLTVESQITQLGTELASLRQLINDFQAATTAIKEDAESTLEVGGIDFNQMPSAPGVGGDPNDIPTPRRKNRNSVIMLDNMWAQELSILFKTVEGAQKFLPAVPGRHILAESAGWTQLNSTTWKPMQPIHVVVLNDHLLVATKKKSRTDSANSVSSGKSQVAAKSMMADMCWPLADIEIEDLSIKGDYNNSDSQSQVPGQQLTGFMVTSGTTSYVYKTETRAALIKVMDAYNRALKELDKPWDIHVQEARASQDSDAFGAGFRGSVSGPSGSMGELRRRSGGPRASVSGASSFGDLAGSRGDDSVSGASTFGSLAGSRGGFSSFSGFGGPAAGGGGPRGSVSGASAGALDPKKGHARNTSHDISERARNLREVDDLINDLDTLIAYRKFDAAVQVIKRNTMELGGVRTFSAAAVAAAKSTSATAAIGGIISLPSSNRANPRKKGGPSSRIASISRALGTESFLSIDIKTLRSQILKIKIEEREKTVTSILFAEISSKENHLGGQKYLIQCIELLIQLGHGETAKRVFLENRRKAIRGLVKRVDYSFCSNFGGGDSGGGGISSSGDEKETHDVVYISQIATIQFRMIQSTVQIYQSCFPLTPSSSGIVEWAQAQVQEFVVLFAKQLYGVDPQSQVYKECADITRQQAVYIKSVGLNLDVLLEYIYDGQPESFSEKDSPVQSSKD